MTGDRVVGWTALFVAGWLAGQWTSGREALGQGHPSPTVHPVPCLAPAYPMDRKAARAWAKRYIKQDSGVILK